MPLDLSRINEAAMAGHELEVRTVALPYEAAFGHLRAGRELRLVEDRPEPATHRRLRERDVRAITDPVDPAVKENAGRLIRNGLSIRAVASRTGLGRGTVERLKKALAGN